MLQRTWFFTTLVCCTKATPTVPQAPAASRYALLVTIDTLRADYLSAYGGPAQTPALTELAQRGWLFEECISASMLTNPSHASILTSLYPKDHGVYDNESGIADGVSTIATALSSAGFQTAAVLGFPHLNPKVSNLGQGFGRVIEAGRKEQRAPEAVATALAVIDRMGRMEPGRPWFVWLHLVDPHAPYEPLTLPRTMDSKTPMSRAQKVAPRFQRNNPWFTEAFDRFKYIEDMTARYLAEVEAADAGLALLIRGLRERGLFDQTVVAVTSDHGENFGEHELYFHHGGLYRETVHVPLVVSAPGLAAVRISALVESVDLAPTLLELLRVPRWQPMRGQSLVGVAAGTHTARTVAFSEHLGGQLASIRSAGATFISHVKNSHQFPSYDIQSGRWEYYVDGDELSPRALDAQGESLKVQLEQHLGTPLGLSPRAPLAQDRQSLRALGYIE